jgi:integrase
MRFLNKKTALFYFKHILNTNEKGEPPRPQHNEMQTMNAHDMHTFLEYVKSTPYYDIFYLALFAGIRRSEPLALRWCDIELLLCQISVARTIHQLHNGESIFRQTKTDKCSRHSIR